MKRKGKERKYFRNENLANRVMGHLKSHGIGPTFSREKLPFFVFVFQIFPTSAIEISSAQMFADAEQLLILTAFYFSPLVACKQITEMG